MTNATLIKTQPINSVHKTLADSFVQQQDPEQVLAFAQKAARALMTVISAKPKKVMINGELFLTFEDYQTLGRFYGVTIGTEFCRPITDEKKAFGYEARAVAYHSGNIISAAEASVSREEPNWRDKPSFQLKSMAQTRASAKALRNVLAWVAVLGGFKPTPFEEMCNPVHSSESSNFTEPIDQGLRDVQADRAMDDYMFEEKQADYDNWQQNNGITDKQKAFLQTLIKEKVEEEEERESKLANLSSMAKWEASEMIEDLLS